MSKRIIAALAAAAIAMAILGCGSSEPAQDSQGVTRTLSEDGTALLYVDEGCEPKRILTAEVFDSEKDFYSELRTVFSDRSDVELATMKTVYNGRTLQTLVITRETYLSHDIEAQEKCLDPKDFSYTLQYDSYELDPVIDFGEYEKTDTLEMVYGA